MSLIRICLLFISLHRFGCIEEKNWDLIYLLKKEADISLTNEFTVLLKSGTDYSKMFLSAKTLFPNNIFPRIFVIILKMKFLNRIKSPGTIFSISDPNSDKRFSLSINMSPGIVDKVTLNIVFHPVDEEMIIRDVYLPFSKETIWTLGLSIIDDKMILYTSCDDVKRPFGFQLITLKQRTDRIFFKDGAIINIFNDGGGSKKLKGEVFELSFANHEGKLQFLCSKIVIEGSGSTRMVTGMEKLGNVLLNPEKEQPDIEEDNDKVFVDDVITTKTIDADIATTVNNNLNIPSDPYTIQHLSLTMEKTTRPPKVHTTQMTVSTESETTSSLTKSSPLIKQSSMIYKIRSLEVDKENIDKDSSKLSSNTFIPRPIYLPSNTKRVTATIPETQEKFGTLPGTSINILRRTTSGDNVIASSSQSRIGLEVTNVPSSTLIDDIGLVDDYDFFKVEDTISTPSTVTDLSVEATESVTARNEDVTNNFKDSVKSLREELSTVPATTEVGESEISTTVTTGIVDTESAGTLRALKERKLSTKAKTNLLQTDATVFEFREEKDEKSRAMDFETTSVGGPFTISLIGNFEGDETAEGKDVNSESTKMFKTFKADMKVREGDSEINLRDKILSTTVTTNGEGTNIVKTETKEGKRMKSERSDTVKTSKEETFSTSSTTKASTTISPSKERDAKEGILDLEKTLTGEIHSTQSTVEENDIVISETIKGESNSSEWPVEDEKNTIISKMKTDSSKITNMLSTMNETYIDKQNEFSTTLFSPSVNSSGRSYGRPSEDNARITTPQKDNIENIAGKTENYKKDAVINGESNFLTKNNVNERSLSKLDSTTRYNTFLGQTINTPQYSEYTENNSSTQYPITAKTSVEGKTKTNNIAKETISIGVHVNVVDILVGKGTIRKSGLSSHKPRTIPEDTTVEWSTERKGRNMCQEYINKLTNLKDCKRGNDRNTLMGIKDAKGDKGEKGDLGPPGIPGQCDASECESEIYKYDYEGEKGDKGDCNLLSCSNFKGDKGDEGAKGSLGQKGARGAPGSINDDVLNPLLTSILATERANILDNLKGKKGEPCCNKPCLRKYKLNNYRRNFGLERTGDLGYGSLVYEDKESFEKIAFQLPIGSMVLLLKLDVFLVKVDDVNNIWRPISLQSRSKDWTLSNIPMSPRIEPQVDPYQRRLTKRRHLIALSMPTPGDLKSTIYQPGGYSGAAFQCRYNGEIHGYGRSMKPFMNTNLSNLKSMLVDKDLNIPIFNARGEKLANDFYGLLSAADALSNEILDFDRRLIRDNIITSCVWIGNYHTIGSKNNQQNSQLRCNNWTTRNPTSEALVSILLPLKSIFSDDSIKLRTCSLQCHILCLQTEHHIQ